MIRTFRSKIDKKTLVLCVLPAAILFVYFFWNQWPLLAFACALFQVFIMERMLHTEYIFTDNGVLLVKKGRFSKVKSYALSDIRSAEVVQSSRIAFLRNKHMILLTMNDGRMVFLIPYPAKEFCQYLMKKKNQLEQKQIDE